MKQKDFAMQVDAWQFAALGCRCAIRGLRAFFRDRVWFGVGPSQASHEGGFMWLGLFGPLGATGH
jgi:hypothetical protein